MWDSPEMLGIYRMLCVVGMIYGVVMIGIWICIGIMGGPCVRFKPPKVPPMPKMPDWPKKSE